MKLVLRDEQDRSLCQLHGIGVPAPYSYGVASKGDLIGSLAFLLLHESHHGVSVLRQGFRQVWTVEANTHCTINGPGDQEGGIKLLGLTHCLGEQFFDRLG